MINTYRWIVAGVFLFLSVLMLNRPVSFPHFQFESEYNLQPVSIEQKEILLSALSRVETRQQQTDGAKIVAAFLRNETIELFVSISISEERIILKEGVGIVFPSKFFETDPVDQEFALSQWMIELAKESGNPDSYLAKVPSSKK